MLPTSFRPTLHLTICMFALLAAPLAQVRFRDPLFSQVEVKADQAYGAAVNRYTQKLETLYLDLYSPKGDPMKARPAVLVVHGGGWVSGSRKSSRFVQMARDFARRGFVAASISYRLVPQGYKRKLPESAEDGQEDTKAAVRWLRRHAASLGIDQERIAAIGSSAGAFNVVMASYYKEEGKSGNPGWSSRIQAVCDLWGGIYDPREVDPGETPCLIIHGTLDPVVPYQLALDLQKACQKASVPVSLNPLVGKGHGPWSEYPRILDLTLPWFYRHLQLVQREGLQAGPGYTAPGILSLHLAGPAGSSMILLLSSAPGNMPIPPLGTLALDLARGFSAATVTLPATPGIAQQKPVFPVPGDLAGATVYWQGFSFYAQPLQPLAFTNLVTTPF